MRKSRRPGPRPDSMRIEDEYLGLGLCLVRSRHEQFVQLGDEQGGFGHRSGCGAFEQMISVRSCLFEDVDGTGAASAGCVQTVGRGVEGHVVDPAVYGKSFKFFSGPGVEDHDGTFCFCVAAADEEPMVGFIECDGHVLVCFGDGPGRGKLPGGAVDDADGIFVGDVDVQSGAGLFEDHRFERLRRDPDIADVLEVCRIDDAEL